MGVEKRGKPVMVVYRWLWKLFRRNEVVMYVQEPVRYVIFDRIKPYLPFVKIVAADKETQDYLRKINVPFRKSPGFPKAVISAHFLRVTYNIPEIKKIHIFHGMAKDVGISEKNEAFDLLLIMGEYARQRFEQMGMHHYKLVGYPKLDPLFNGSLDAEKIKKELGLDGGRPTLLYAPSWGVVGSVPLIKDELCKLGRSGRYNIIVKLHDKSREWRNTFSGVSGIKIVTDPDIVPYYWISDLLISDYSSVIFEFAVLDRPIVLVDTDVKRYAKQSVGNLWRDIGERVQDPAQLEAAIENSLANPKEYEAKRMEYSKSLFFGQDGKAGERAAQAVIDFLEHETDIPPSIWENNRGKLNGG